MVLIHFDILNRLGMDYERETDRRTDRQTARRTDGQNRLYSNNDPR